MKKLMIFVFVSAFSISVMAQQPPQQQPQGSGQGTKSSIAGPRKHMATILFAGLGGAVLGLSTLSFYGRPQDKLSNIAIGFAIGVIGGTGFVTWKAISSPADFYANLEPDLERVNRQISRTALFAEPPAASLAQWTFQF